MISIQSKCGELLIVKFGWNKDGWLESSLMNTFPFIGLAISRWIAPRLLAKGRRRCLLYTPLCSFIAIFVQIFPFTNNVSLYFGRFLQGLVCGVIFAATTRLVEEYSPTIVFATYLPLFNAVNSLSKFTLMAGAKFLPECYKDCPDK